MPRFTEAEAHRLLTHVRRGGGVVVSVGGRVDLAAYNDVLFRGGAGLLPARLVEKQSDNEDYSYQFMVEPALEREPAFKAFTDSRPREMLLAAHFRQFLKVEPAVKGDPAHAVVLRAGAAAGQESRRQAQRRTAAGRAGAVGMATAGRQGRARRADNARPRRPADDDAQRRLE